VVRLHKPIDYQAVKAAPQDNQREMNRDLLKAVDLALAGQWDEAHRVVQRYEADATAAWIHAVLHKIEGDLDNSRYWYRRADKLDCVAQEPLAELRSIKAGIEN
jgi:hypothetical protein